MAPAPDDWMLHRVGPGLGPWPAWSASAHTLALGSVFACLILLLARRGAPGMPPWLDAVLAASALAAFLPLAVLAALRERRRVRAVAIDPAGLTLSTGQGEVRVPFADLRTVRTRAEPMFGSPTGGAKGPAGSFAATLTLQLRDGTTWAFSSGSLEDVTGLLAWLQVLAPPDTIALPPSARAAQRNSDDSMTGAARWLLAAIGAAGVGVALQLANQFYAFGAAFALPAGIACIGLACALYATSYAAQVRASRAWLQAQGLRSGPPVDAPLPAPLSP